MDALNADEVQSYLHAPEFGIRLHWVRFRSSAGTGASGQVAPIATVRETLVEPRESALCRPPATVRTRFGHRRDGSREPEKRRDFRRVWDCVQPPKQPQSGLAALRAQS